MASFSTPRITILIDNHDVVGLTAEHGLSLWIEKGNHRILFDTGQSGAFAGNASRLGIDLQLADGIVLSHGHYDHTGGLSQALRVAHRAAVYCHPAAVTPRYSLTTTTPLSIRMPPAAQMALDRLPLNKLHWLQKDHHLNEEIGLTGPIPRTTGFEDTGGPFFLDLFGRRPDPIDDDLALWLATERGLIVVVGCAHAGLINTLDHIAHLNGGQRIRAVIGGFHLLNAAPERLERTVAALRSYSPELIVPCHCTGDAAVSCLLDAFGERVCPGTAGMICDLDRNGRLAVSYPADSIPTTTMIA